MEIVSIFSSDKKHYYAHLLSQYHRASAQGYVQLLLLRFMCAMHYNQYICDAQHFTIITSFIRHIQYATIHTQYDLLKDTNRNNSSIKKNKNVPFHWSKHIHHHHYHRRHHIPQNERTTSQIDSFLFTQYPVLNSTLYNY